MKRKSLLLIVMILLSWHIGYSQYDCFFNDSLILRSPTIVSDCDDYCNYIPDSTTSVLEVKINFHFFRNDDGTGIYQPSDSGLIDTAMQWLNHIFKNLEPPTLPTPNLVDTIVDSKIAFKLTGVYYHDVSYYYNNYSYSVYDIYGVNKGSEINIFFYLNPAFENPGGWAFSDCIFMHNIPKDRVSLWANTQMLGHELGHSLGLPHTWNDSFDDTFYPDDNLTGAQCNNYDVSNNIMGYNACRNYLSPKQLGRMHYGILSNPSRMKILTCFPDNSDTSLHITKDTVFDHSAYFNKSLIIDSGKTLTVACNLYFTKESRLIVCPGGKLVVDGGTLTSACPGEMWQGIEVVGDRTKRQLAQYQGIVELRNGATIENAHCGIRTGLQGDASYATTGGIIRAEDAYFINNRRSVEFLSYTNHALNGSVTNNQSYFTGCSFTVNDDNLFSQGNGQFIDHVTLWEVKGIAFNGCTFENATTAQGDRRHAIYAEDAGFTVDKRCTDPVYNPSTCTCNAFVRSTFSGFAIAIEANTSGNQFPVKIDHSRFSENGTGVRINGNHFATVTRCDFDLTTNPQEWRYLYGLYLSGCSGFKVEANQFDGTVQYVDGITTGVYVNGSGSSVNSLYKNEFDNLSYGIHAYGNNSGLQIRCNEFDGSGADIFVPSGSSIASSQGSLQTSAGNKFMQAYGYNIFNGGAQTITYYYKNSTTNSYAEPVLNSSGVSVTPSNTANNCASTLCGITPLDPTPFLLAGFQSDMNAYTTAMAGNNDADGRDIAGGTGVETQNFASLQQGGTENLLETAQSLSDSYYTAVRTLMSDSLLDLGTLEQWHTAAQPIADPYSLTETRFCEGYAELFAADVDDAEMANYAEFHAMKLALRVQNDNLDNQDNSGTPFVNWYALTPAQIAQLQTIAERNTGRASVMAKGALCFFHGICYEDDLLVDDNGDNNAGTRAKRVTTDIADDAALTVYPNPTDDLLFVELRGAEIARVALYDLQGRMVTGTGAHAGAPQQGTTATMNMRNVPAGVYLLCVTAADGKEYHRKIVKR